MLIQTAFSQALIIMQIIDSHVHVCTENPDYPWAIDGRDSPTINANPDDLIDLLKKNGVRRAVLVQYIKYRWDNSYVAHVMKTFPSLFWGVCRVDPENPESPDQLSYWTEIHGFQGVRLSPQEDMRGDWFRGPFMEPLFKRAATLKIPIVVLTKPIRLGDLARIIDRVPDVNVVIDHFADCLNQTDEDLKKLLVLARYPNVYLKLGHISQHSSEIFPWRDTHISLEKIFQTFGAERIMWGSDWPFCLNHMTYAQSLAYVLDGVKFFTAADQEWLTSKTALRIWK